MLADEDAWVLNQGVYVPSEVWAPMTLANKPGSETVVRLRGWRELIGKDSYRIIMDYYNHGNLYDLRYRELKPMRDVVGFQPRIPQPFLWYVFECLAIAGLLMVSDPRTPFESPSN